MTVKIALLKSGENVIADIKELISEENIVGYLFEDPCIIEYNDTEQIYLSEEIEYGKPVELQVTLSPWILFTEDTKIPVRPDWIVTVVNPAKKIKELYEDKSNGNRSETLGENEEKSEDIIIGEQSDSFIAD